MEIRIAKKTDNFLEIADLIYETDNYIYPNMSNSRNESIDILIDMVKSDTMYNYNNCVIAIENNQIIGLLVFNHRESSKKNSYDKWINQSPKCKHVIENYILNCENQIKNKQIQLICVCVNIAFRRQKIGTRLIKFIIKMFPDHDLILDTLKNNIAAINLYKSLGFKVMKEQKGYNSYHKQKPICYRMTKQYHL